MPMRPRRDATTLRVSRLLHAPCEEVFRAWTDPEQLRLWLTPIVGSSPSAKVDLRVGGSFEVAMTFGIWTGRFFGTYLEVDPPARLVFTWAAEGMGLDLGQTLVTVELHPRDDATELVLVHERNPSRRARAFHAAGWRRTLAALDRWLQRGRVSLDRSRPWSRHRS